MSKATNNANSAIDSVNAKPNNPTGNRLSFTEGFLAIEVSHVEKMFPMLRPTPNKANNARLAPIIRAASGDISYTP